MVGVAPIRSLCRVGWAARQLVSIPSDLLRAPTGQQQEVAVSRQLHRALAGFVRAVTLEALGLGATLAGGAQHLLGAPTAEEQPAGVQAHPVAHLLPGSTVALLCTGCMNLSSSCHQNSSSLQLPVWFLALLLFAAKVRLGRNQEGLQESVHADQSRTHHSHGMLCHQLCCGHTDFNHI